ncbi:MAG: DMT family transporter [Promethearchaeota archaeon]
MLWFDFPDGLSFRPYVEFEFRMKIITTFMNAGSFHLIFIQKHVVKNNLTSVEKLVDVHLKQSVKGYLFCFLGVLQWSFSEIIVRLLQDDSVVSSRVGPVSLSFYRFFFGGLFLLTILLIKRDLSGMKDIIRHNLKPTLIASMFGLGFSNVIYFIGVAMTQANIGAALYTSYPIFIGIYGMIILNERGNIPLKIIGFVIGLTGIIILMTNFNLILLFKPSTILGNILLLSAAAIWALYSVLGKKVMNANPKIKNIEIKWTTLSFFLACVPILIILPFYDRMSKTGGELPNFLRHDLTVWVLILIMAFSTTAFGLYIFFKGVKLIQVSHGISLSLFKPILVTFFSYFILPDEKIPDALFVSIPLVFLAVFLINKK